MPESIDARVARLRRQLAKEWLRLTRRGDRFWIINTRTTGLLFGGEWGGTLNDAEEWAAG
jgi:hypothetical protein